jgi:hypothetical protein
MPALRPVLSPVIAAFLTKSFEKAGQKAYVSNASWGYPLFNRR